MRRKDDDPARFRRVRKGLYLLPSLFTAGNIAAGYYSIFQSIQGSASDPWHFDMAAKAIGIAVVLDFLDGRIARMTNTASAFGRELDSLADVITFGVAPAVLAWLWGFRMLPAATGSQLAGFLQRLGLSASEHDVRTQLVQLGAVATFLFLAAGACRLARFNIELNPQPSNPGRPGRKYFVGMPIPSGAGVIAAVVHFVHGEPPYLWWHAALWGLGVFAIAFLMVSRWRFPSLKGLDFRQRHPARLLVVICAIIWLIYRYSNWVLFIIAITYTLWGVLSRLFYALRRSSTLPPAPPDEVVHAE